MGSATDLPALKQSVRLRTKSSKPHQVRRSICASSRGDPPLGSGLFASPRPSLLSILSPSTYRVFRPNPTGSDQFRPDPTEKKYFFIFSGPLPAFPARTTDNELTPCQSQIKNQKSKMLMHPTTKLGQFMTLRANGWSLDKIAKNINVSKGTLCPGTSNIRVRSISSSTCSSSASRSNTSPVTKRN